MTNIPINSAIALKTHVWLVLFACKKAGLVCKQTTSLHNTYHQLRHVHKTTVNIKI